MIPSSDILNEEQKQNRLAALAIKKVTPKKLKQEGQSVSCFTSRGGGNMGTPVIVRKEEIRIKDRPQRLGATTAIRQRHSNVD